MRYEAFCDAAQLTRGSASREVYFLFARGRPTIHQQSTNASSYIGYIFLVYYVTAGGANSMYTSLEQNSPPPSLENSHVSLLERRVTFSNSVRQLLEALLSSPGHTQRYLILENIQHSKDKEPD